MPAIGLHQWLLFGINAERVRDDLRERVIRYQRECYRVLAEAFTEGRLTTDADLFDLLDNEASEAVQAYKMLQALVKLARNQIVIEARLEKHGQTLEDHGRRLETIEADLHQANRTVTEAQATQISQSVRAIAIVLGKSPIVTNLALYGASFTGNLASVNIVTCQQRDLMKR